MVFVLGFVDPYVSDIGGLICCWPPERYSARSGCLYFFSVVGALPVFIAGFDVDVKRALAVPALLLLEAAGTDCLAASAAFFDGTIFAFSGTALKKLVKGNYFNAALQILVSRTTRMSLSKTKLSPLSGK